MICATKSLAAPKIQVAQITGNFVLPKPVELVKIAGSVGGALVGLIIAVILPLPVGPTLMSLIVATFGIAGFGTVVYSPLQGESVASWMMLKLRRRSRRVEINGTPIQLAVGICRVKGMTLGTVNLEPAAVDVAVGSVDERGAYVTTSADSEGAVEQLNQQTLSIEDAISVLSDEPQTAPSAHMARLNSLRDLRKASVSSEVEELKRAQELDDAGFTLPKDA